MKGRFGSGEGEDGRGGRDEETERSMRNEAKGANKAMKGRFDPGVGENGRTKKLNEGKMREVAKGVQQMETLTEITRGGDKRKEGG